MRPVVRMRSGMTLLELLVALVVTGIALVAGYAALSTVIDRRMGANAAIEQAARAASIRRTIVDWLAHGQLQFATGTGVPQDAMSSTDLGMTGTANDQLQFVTTASTPLHRDSTVVQLYVNTPDALSYGTTITTPGLIAVLTPTQSAQNAALQASSEDPGAAASWGSSPFARTGGGSGQSGGDLLDEDNLQWGSFAISLESAVTGLQVDYLVQQFAQGQATEPPQWIPSSQWQSQRGNGMSIMAVRLTLYAQGRQRLPPVLVPPIVVPVTITAL